MGDMADMVNDGMDLTLFGPGGTKECRMCGKSGLNWVNIGTNFKPIWRLADGGIVHECRTKVNHKSKSMVGKWYWTGEEAWKVLSNYLDKIYCSGNPDDPGDFWEDDPWLYVYSDIHYG